MRSVLAAILLMMVSPVSAGHPWSSPLNPNSSDTWEQIGTFPGDANQPAGKLYVNVNEMDIYDRGGGVTEVRAWKIYDSPRNLGGKNVTELALREYLNCSTNTVADRYWVAFDTYGNQVGASDDLHDTFDELPSNTIGGLLLKRICSK
jgi:hypothetical protein